MVQAEQVDGKLIVIGQGQHVADKHLHADRDITYPDKAFEIGVAIDRFGHHAGRVGKVDYPRLRADLLHVFDDVEYHRNGTQPFKQATGTVGLLAQIAVAQRDTLIQLARLKLANTQLGGDEIGIFQRLATIEGFMHGHRHARFFNHALAQVKNNIELLLAFGHVHQPQFADRQFMITLEEPFQ